jgi:hypothetical protein
MPVFRAVVVTVVLLGLLLVGVAQGDARVVQVATLTSSVTMAGGGFAGLAEAHGVLVSDDGAATDVFVASTAGWRSGAQKAVLSERLAPGSMSTSGAVVIGATSTGSVRELVFDRPAARWSGTVAPSASLAASTGTTITDAVISGRTIVAAGQDGAIYVYSEPPGGWSGTVTETARLVDSGGAGFVQTPDIAAGRVFAESFQAGRIDVFTEPPGGWAGVVHESSTIASPPFSVDVAGSYALGGDEPLPDPTLGFPVYREGAAGWSGTLSPIAHLYNSSAEGLVADRALSGGLAAVSTQEDAGSQNPCPCAKEVSVFSEPPGGWSGTLTARPSVRTTALDAGLVLDRRTLFTTSRDGVYVYTVTGPEGQRLRRPAASGSTATGIARRQPLLQFTLSAASGAPALEWLKLTLPKGLSLVADRATLQRAVTIPLTGFDHTAISSADGALLIRPLGEFRHITVRIRTIGLRESRTLAEQLNNTSRHGPAVTLKGHIRTRDTVGDLQTTMIRFRLLTHG